MLTVISQMTQYRKRPSGFARQRQQPAGGGLVRRLKGPPTDDNFLKLRLEPNKAATSQSAAS